MFNLFAQYSTQDPNTSYSESWVLILLGMSVLIMAYAVGISYFKTVGMGEVRRIINKYSVFAIGVLGIKFFITAPLYFFVYKKHDQEFSRQRRLSIAYIILASIAMFAFIARVNNIISLP